MCFFISFWFSEDTNVSLYSSKRLVPTTKSQLSHVIRYIIGKCLSRSRRRKSRVPAFQLLNPLTVFHLTWREMYARGRKIEVLFFSTSCKQWYQQCRRENLWERIDTRASYFVDLKRFAAVDILENHEILLRYSTVYIVNKLRSGEKVVYLSVT